MLIELHIFSGLAADRPPPGCWRLVTALGLSILIHALIALVLADEHMVDRGRRQVVFVQLLKHGEDKLVVEGVRADRAAKRTKSSLGVAAKTDLIEAEPESWGGAPGQLGGVPPGEPTYFPSESLTIRPYPITALDEMLDGVTPTEMFGKAVLKIRIGATGEVAEMETGFSDMPEAFHVAVLAAFERMRFMPGQVDGKPVACIMEIEISAEDFRLPAQ